MEFAPEAQQSPIPSPAIQYIKKSLAITFENDLRKKETLYRHWYKKYDRSLLALAGEWRTTGQDTHYSCFGMPWSLVTLQKECNLTDEQIELYKKAMDKGTTMQFRAYYLAVGPARFMKGPHEVVVQFVLTCNLKELTTYATLAQGQVGWICQLIRVFDPRDERNLVRTFLRNVNHIRLWIYSTQVNVSGLLVDGDRAKEKLLIDFDTLHKGN